MDNRLMDALKALDVSTLSHGEWISVGMALKQEGYPVEVWDDWSRNDRRYHPGECERRWNSFGGAANPVKAGTIIEMARQRGWSPWQGGDGVMGWTDVIESDGSEPDAAPRRKAGEDLILYLQALFEPDEHVGYVCEAAQREDGGWRPASAGYYDRTAGELIADLRRHPDDIGAVLGDWNKEAGAWIRFNPLDGGGVRNDNVTRFSYALVESDSMSTDEQITLYRRLELPIAALVSSAGKSVHAIVKVDAPDRQEYDRRVMQLYDVLERHGVKVDKQNKNPSRLSRLPGATRNGKVQKLLGVNLGRRSWADWLDYMEGESDELPDIVSIASVFDNPPPLPEELISGVLRRGHKMLISGDSKSGKSFLLMELAICIAEGRDWLGFGCRKGRVLYVNFEIDPASAIHRILDIYHRMDLPSRHLDDLLIWNLRGKVMDLEKLTPKLIRRVGDMGLDAIIVDPIYKVITGDENNASEMGQFCNYFDKIAADTGCAVIYCHHHSKGAQGAKKAMDRASGSGVFARDPDAQLDVTELVLSESEYNRITPAAGARPFRLSCTLREFANPGPVNFWFDWPMHFVDRENLNDAPEEGSPMGNLAMSGKRTNTHEARREALDMAFEALSIEPPVTIKAVAEYLELSTDTVKNYVDENSGDYCRRNGCIFRKCEK